MKHGSLFSGIGGFDLAAEWMGWENSFHCEWNPFGQKVLKHYWPNAESFTDIKKTDFTKYANKIDVLTGGFPCQPYSTAGKQRGKDDDRHLWPEMLRVIREVKPRFVVGENVRGLISWQGGVVFDEVQIDLETEGYEIIPFLLPACSVNAPHKRERVWFVAHSDKCKSSEIKRNFEKVCGLPFEKSESKNGSALFGGKDPGSNEQRFITNSGNDGLQGGGVFRGFGKEYQAGRSEAAGCFRNEWENFPAQSPLCNGNDGFSTGLDGITFSKWRDESIKAGGNAIVPQVAYEIFKVICQMSKKKITAID